MPQATRHWDVKHISWRSTRGGSQGSLQKVPALGTWRLCWEASSDRITRHETRTDKHARQTIGQALPLELKARPSWSEWPQRSLPKKQETEVDQPWWTFRTAIPSGIRSFFFFIKTLNKKIGTCYYFIQPQVSSRKPTRPTNLACLRPGKNMEQTKWRVLRRKPTSSWRPSSRPPPCRSSRNPKGRDAKSRPDDSHKLPRLTNSHPLPPSRRTYCVLRSIAQRSFILPQYHLQ